jgi:hypothetical protein
MKAISLYQPWATAMALGSKQIETRGRLTHFRGQLAICAAKKRWTTRDIPIDVHRWMRNNLGSDNLENILVALPYGKVVCVVTVYDCRDAFPRFGRRGMIEERSCSWRLPRPRLSVRTIRLDDSQFTETRNPRSGYRAPRAFQSAACRRGPSNGSIDTRMTNIEWTDLVDNIFTVYGGGWWCRRISEGCDNCYAATLNKNSFFGGNHLEYSGDRPADLILRPEIISGWKKMTKPKRHFVASMTDIFGEWVTELEAHTFLTGMWVAPKQTFQMLTKRPLVAGRFIKTWLELTGLKELRQLKIRSGLTFEFLSF